MQRRSECGVGRQRAVQERLLPCAVSLLAHHKRCMAASLERLAEWVLVQGHPVAATTLHGAADALRVTSASPVPPLHQPLHQPTIANLRGTLGAETFAAGWDTGWALDSAALRAYVLTLTEADAICASARGDEG